MAINKLFNRVLHQVVGAPGIGDVTLGAAVAGYTTFNLAGAVHGDVVSYVLVDRTRFEVGTGTYSYSAGTGTISRDTVRLSSDGTNKVSMTAAARIFSAEAKEDLEAFFDRSNHTGVQDPTTIAPQGTGSTLDSDLLDGQHGAYYLNRANHTGAHVGTLPSFASKAAAAASTNISTATMILVDGFKYRYTATPVTHVGGFENTGVGSRWFEYAEPVFWQEAIDHPDIGNEDANASATAAFALGLPLQVARANAVLQTSFSSFSTNRERHEHMMKLFEWRKKCIVGANGIMGTTETAEPTLVIQITDTGLISVDAYAALPYTAAPVPFWGAGASGAFIMQHANTPQFFTITGITYGTANANSYVSGTNPYPIIRDIFSAEAYQVTLDVSAPLPAYVDRGYSVGLRNTQGDNDAEAATGAMIVETRISDTQITGTIFSGRAAPLVSPTSVAGSTFAALTANQLMVPYACIGWHTDFTVGANLTITAITQASAATVTSAAHGLTTGQFVRISGVAGMTQVNNRMFRVGTTTTDTFVLQNLNAANIDSTGFTAYSSGGVANQVTEAWTGSNYEGYFNFYGNTVSSLLNIGLSYRGWTEWAATGTQMDQDAIQLYGAGTHLKTQYVVGAGAGDKIIRGVMGALHDSNQCCFGGGGAQEPTLYQQFARAMHLRGCIGSGAQENVVVGEFSSVDFKDAIIAGGNAGVQIIGPNSAAYFSASTKITSTEDCFNNQGGQILFDSGLELKNSTTAFNGSLQNSIGGVTTPTLTSITNTSRMYAGSVTLTYPPESLTITNVERAANVVTITFSGAHGITHVAGRKWVTVAAVTNTSVNGAFVIASVPTTTTITYAQTGGDIASGADTGTVVAEAVVCDALSGVITTPSLTTAAGSTYSFKVRNNLAGTAAAVVATVNGGTNTRNHLLTVSRANGSFTINIKNIESADAFNGTIVVAFYLVGA